MGRNITLFKGYKRINVPVRLTAKGLKMFPGEPCGTLVRFAGDGRWVVRRDGQSCAYYWATGFWKRITALEQKK